MLTGTALAQKNSRFKTVNLKPYGNPLGGDPHALCSQLQKKHASSKSRKSFFAEHEEQPSQEQIQR